MIRTGRYDRRGFRIKSTSIPVKPENEDFVEDYPENLAEYSTAVYGEVDGDSVKTQDKQENYIRTGQQALQILRRAPRRRVSKRGKEISSKKKSKKEYFPGNSPRSPDSSDDVSSYCKPRFGRRVKHKSSSSSLKLVIQHCNRPENTWSGPLDKRYAIDECV